MKRTKVILLIAIAILINSAYAYADSASNTHYRLLSDTRSLHNSASNVQAQLGQKLQQVADWEAADIQMMIDAWRAGGQSDRAMGLGWSAGAWSEYGVALNRGLMVAEVRGMESTKLRAYYGSLMGRYDRLEMFDASSLTPSTFTGDYDPEELKAAEAKSAVERQMQKQSGALAFLQATIRKDPGQAFADIKRIDASLSRLSSADQAQRSLEIEDLEARQAQIQEFASYIPLIGEATDILAAVSGEGWDGKRLGTLERALLIMSTFAPDIIEKALTGTPGGREMMSKFRTNVAKLNSPALVAAWQAGNKDINLLKKFGGGNPLTSNKNLSEFMDEPIDDLIMNAANPNTPTSKVANEAWEAAEAAGRQEAETLLDLIKKNNGDLANNADFKKAYENCRKNKRCLNELNETRVTCPDGNYQDCLGKFKENPDHDARKALLSFEQGLHDEIDDSVANSLVSEYLSQGKVPPNMADMQAQLKRAWKQSGEGMEWEDFLKSLEVKPFNATNATKDATEDSAKGLFDKELEGTKLGMDRDNTFQIVTKDGNKVDLPADVVKEAYAKTLFEKLNPGKKYDPTKIDAGEYLEEMDHAILTRFSKDAYYFGSNHEEKLKKFLAGEVPIDPGLADRLGQTMHVKADEFYERFGHRPASELSPKELVDYAEGMRQTTKQAKNQLNNAMKAAEVDHIPYTLNRGLTIMEQVGKKIPGTNRTFSPADAENALAQIGMTPAKVSEELGNYYSYVLKLGSTKIYGNTAEGVGFAMSQTAGKAVIGGARVGSRLAIKQASKTAAPDEESQ